MVDVRHLAAKLREVGGDLVLFPRSFAPPTIETAFRDNHARHLAPQRRLGIYLALPTWLAFSYFDFANLDLSSGVPDNRVGVVTARIIGTLAIVIGTIFTASPKFLEDRYSSVIVYTVTTICYICSLYMVVSIDYPFSYVVDSFGLLLLIVIIVGTFRPRVKILSCFLLVALPSTVIGLYYSNWQSLEVYAAHRSKPSESTVFTGLNDYYTSVITYLTLVMIFSYTTAVQLERTARTTFQNETDLYASLDDLRETERDLRRANRQQSRFIADATHDLSQPTHAMTYLADLVRKAVEAGDLATLATRVDQLATTAQSARDSFEAVLDVSRFDTGDIKPALSIFDANALVAEVGRSSLILANEKGVSLRVRPSRVTPLTVVSDRDLLRRVLENLGTNAIKYSDPGKGARRGVSIGVTALPDRVRFDVVDNGIGIPASQISSVFKRFTRIQHVAHDHERGMGLGLSIVDSIMTLLRTHELRLRSVEGRGTRVSLDVPRQPGGIVASLAKTVAGAPEVDLSSLFILYVEDHDMARLATTAFLTSLRITVEPLASFEALERELPEIERRPDLILTDHHLPRRYRAPDVVRSVSVRWGSDIPVIVLTGSLSPTNELAFGNPVRILRKPADPEALVSAMIRLCLAHPHKPEAPEE